MGDEFDGVQEPEYPQKRKNVLAPGDVIAIVNEMKNQGLVHVCRYDIEPEDMKTLLEFTKCVRDSAIETRKTVWRVVRKVLIWGAVAGFLAWLSGISGALRDLSRTVLRMGP